MAFPSPAQDYKEKPLSIDDYLVHRPETTFFFEVTNDAMIGDQITAHHKIAVDRSLLPITGSIVLAVLNNNFLVRRIEMHGKTIILKSSNSKFSQIVVGAFDSFEVFGVVVGSFRRHV